MRLSNAQVEGYRFGDIYIDSRNRQLWRGGELVPLNSKYFDVLLLLVRQRGQLVEKQSLFNQVWDGVFVSDAALTQCIKDIRKQLGDDASNPRYIKTVPKHGYIFIARVAETVAQDDGSDPSLIRVPFIQRPYKFLDYFGEQDAPLFFGRENEIELICSRIISHRTFILHGRSGVGKSSIARAGLAPRLRSEGHRAFVLHSSADVLADMARVSSASPPVQPGERTESILEESVKQFYLTSHGKTVFLLDSFEDFFVMLDIRSREVFLQGVLRLWKDESVPAHLVFILREDMLAGMSDLKQAMPEIYHHEYRLQRLTRDQAVRAILQPAKLSGCRFESELVDTIIRDLSEEARVDPPPLQIVCDSLYDAREADGSITMAAYERLGTASSILSGYFERVLDRLNASDLRLAQELLKAFISPEGHRAVVRPAELEARLEAAAPGQPVPHERLIRELLEARILRSRTEDNERWLELAHEFLIPEICRWLTSEDRSLLEARAVLKRALENYLAHKLHLDADALALVLRFGERLCLVPDEADLLLKSLLHHAGPVPEWIVRAAPSARQLIGAASQDPEPTVRIGAVHVSSLLGDDDTRERLRIMALRDSSVGVREAASLALAEMFGKRVVETLSEESAEDGILRSAGSLAVIRDRKPDLVRFPLKSIVLTGQVMFALALLRFREAAIVILRSGTGGTLGGGVSGFLGSFFLGVALTAARGEPMNEAVSLIFVLVCLGFFVGALGGCGVGFGLAAGVSMSRKHQKLWGVLAGAAGGGLVGGSAKLLGVDALKALFGQHPSGVTGSFEGVIMGAGVALGVVLLEGEKHGDLTRRGVLGATVGGLCAGAFLAFIGGNLFSGSLEIVARSFADSKIRMDPIAGYFGETDFGRMTQVILGAVEGLIFGAGVGAGMKRGARSV